MADLLFSPDKPEAYRLSTTEALARAIKAIDDALLMLRTGASKWRTVRILERALKDINEPRVG